MNERVEAHGHYLIVVDGWSDLAINGLESPGLVVVCQSCGLRHKSQYIGRMQDVSEYSFAAEIVRQALARFADKGCDAVRLQLIAESVMES